MTALAQVQEEGRIRTVGLHDRQQQAVAIRDLFTTRVITSVLLELQNPVPSRELKAFWTEVFGCGHNALEVLRERTYETDPWQALGIMALLTGHTIRVKLLPPAGGFRAPQAPPAKRMRCDSQQGAAPAAAQAQLYAIVPPQRLQHQHWRLLCRPETESAAAGGGGAGPSTSSAAACALAGTQLDRRQVACSDVRGALQEAHLREQQRVTHVQLGREGGGWRVQVLSSRVPHLRVDVDDRYELCKVCLAERVAGEVLCVCSGTMRGGTAVCMLAVHRSQRPAGSVRAAGGQPGLGLAVPHVRSQGRSRACCCSGGWHWGEYLGMSGLVLAIGRRLHRQRAPGVSGQWVLVLQCAEVDQCNYSKHHLVNGGGLQLAASCCRQQALWLLWDRPSSRVACSRNCLEGGIAGCMLRYSRLQWVISAAALECP
jgi:hypothetical protein